MVFRTLENTVLQETFRSEESEIVAPNIQNEVGLFQQVFEPFKTFGQAITQSLAAKPAMALRGVTTFTRGEAFGVDKVLNKTAEFLESLRNPNTKEEIERKMQGKLFPVQEGAKWTDVDISLLPEVINSWAANIGDQIPLMLMTLTGRVIGKAGGKLIAPLFAIPPALATAGPDPTDVVTVPAVVAATQKIVEHLGGAAPLIAVEAGGFLDQAESIGIDKDIAEKYARTYGVGSGAIEYAQVLWNLKAFRRLTGPAKKTLLRRVLTELGGNLFEGVEEFSQEGLQNFFLGKAIDDMKARNPEFEARRPRIFEGGGRAFAIGTGVSIVTRGFGRASVTVRGKLSTEAQKEVDTATEELVAVSGAVEPATIEEAPEVGPFQPTEVEPIAEVIAPAAEVEPTRPPVIPEAERPLEAKPEPVAAKEEEVPKPPAIAPPKAPEAKPTVEVRPPEQTVTEKTPKIQTKVAETVETDFTKATSARQAALAEDRKSMGLDEINSKSRRSWEKALGEAKKDKIASKANRLAEEVSANPRPLTDIETAGVTIRMTELKNEHKEAMEAVAKAKDDVDIKTLSAEVDRIEAEFDALTKAVDTSGTEKGRALAAQKLTINKDFSLISVLNRAKVAAGKKLTAVQNKIFKGLTEKLQKTTKRVEVLEAEVNDLKARSEVRRGNRRFKAMNLKQKNQSLDNLVAKAKLLLKAGCNN